MPMNFFFQAAMLLAIAVWRYYSWMQLSPFWYGQLHQQAAPDKPTILLLDIQKGFGGGQVHFLTYYHLLIEQGYRVIPCVRINSPLDHRLREQKIDHYAIPIIKLQGFKRAYFFGLARLLKSVVKRHKVSIIHANVGREVFAARSVARSIPVSVVLTWHTSDIPHQPLLRCCDGVIAVQQSVAAALQRVNDEQHLGIKNVISVPPFFETERFLRYQPTQSRDQFFKEQWGVDLQPGPLILDIAQLYSNKNPQLLIKAAAHLIKDKKMSVNVVFAGDGKAKPSLQALTADLGISESVHFIGFTDKTPDLLYHADVQVLPSKKEALGIVLLEGALMKKPLIGIVGTGMEQVIIHEKTGLLVASDDVHGLADALEQVLDDKNYAQMLGNNVHQLVLSHFLPQRWMSVVAKFYEHVENKDRA